MSFLWIALVISIVTNDIDIFLPLKKILSNCHRQQIFLTFTFKKHDANSSVKKFKLSDV